MTDLARFGEQPLGAGRRGEIPRLRADDEVLVIGIAETVALPPEKLTGSNFGMRRSTNEEKQP